MSKRDRETLYVWYIHHEVFGIYTCIRALMEDMRGHGSIYLTDEQFTEYEKRSDGVILTMLKHEMDEHVFIEVRTPNTPKDIDL